MTCCTRLEGYRLVFDWRCLAKRKLFPPLENYQDSRVGSKAHPRCEALVDSDVSDSMMKIFCRSLLSPWSISNRVSWPRCLDAASMWPTGLQHLTPAPPAIRLVFGATITESKQD
jgi:hypothetical protein